VTSQTKTILIVEDDEPTQKLLDARMRRHVPVIVCTAAGLKTTDGFDRSIVRAVVRKPFDIDHVAALVTDFAGSH
jgi:CheY-like chemotaxis protein